jgi:hypothetical protein
VTTLPPPPNYAPTAGRPTTWWTADTATTLTKAPIGPSAADQEQGEETAEPADPPAWWTSGNRKALADRAAYQVAGGYAQSAAARIAPLLDTPDADPEETEPKQKPTAEERAAANTARARHFRRWCTLTALSACLGTELHLPQTFASVISRAWSAGGMWVGTGAAGFLIGTTWAADWYLRGGTRETGATPVSQVRRKRLPILVVVRTPFASALVAGLGADGLLAAANTAAHHLFH